MATVVGESIRILPVRCGRCRPPSATPGLRARTLWPVPTTKRNTGTSVRRSRGEPGAAAFVVLRHRSAGNRCRQTESSALLKSGRDEPGAAASLPLVVWFSTTPEVSFFSAASLPLLVWFSTTPEESLFSAASLPLVVWFSTTPEVSFFSAASLPLVVWFSTTPEESLFSAASLPLVVWCSTTPVVLGWYRASGRGGRPVVSWMVVPERGTRGRVRLGALVGFHGVLRRMS